MSFEKTQEAGNSAKKIVFRLLCLFYLYSTYWLLLRVRFSFTFIMVCLLKTSYHCIPNKGRLIGELLLIVGLFSTVLFILNVTVFRYSDNY